MFRSKKIKINQPIEATTPGGNQIEDTDINGEDSREESSDEETPSTTVWKDVADIKEKDVEIIDDENKTSRRKGTITPAEVWTLEKGLKFVVKFNTLMQPIEKGGHILIRFLGDIAKNGSLCPLGEINWHHVQECYKIEIVKLVRDKFYMPKGLVIDVGVLSKVGCKWRSYKYRLRKHHFDPAKTEVQNSNKVPNGVVKEQWIRLVHYWCSPQGKKLSDLGKRARAVKDDCHTTGSKSYAQKINNFVETHKRDPSNLEFWKVTHQRKDESDVENTTTEEFMETAQDLVDKNMAASSKKSRIVVENEVLNELMYDKDIPNQRLIGYGHGVCRSQIFGWKVNLSKRISGDDSTGEDAIKEELEILRQENKQLQHNCGSMATQLSQITSFLLKQGVILDDSEECVNMNTENVMRGASSKHNDQSANSSFSGHSS